MARLLAELRVPGWFVGALLCFGLGACFGGYGRERHVSGFRSPSYDYQQVQRASGGDVLGADGKQLADKLSEGPTHKSLAPGWRLRRKEGLTYDPNQRVGGSVEPPREEQPSASPPPEAR